jgi:acetoin utilization deacetylase AcuC-like enzyme
VAIIDLDAHQGDGNAEMFSDDPDVATLSVHEEALFPKPKLRSTIDVGVPSHLGDDSYLTYVDAALNVLARRFRPELIIYIAGVDPHETDPLSTLRVSADGIVKRDEQVARFAREHRAGLVMLPAGGYTTESPKLSAAGMNAVAQLEA